MGAATGPGMPGPTTGPPIGGNPGKPTGPAIGGTNGGGIVPLTTVGPAAGRAAGASAIAGGFVAFTYGAGGILVSISGFCGAP